MSELPIRARVGEGKTKEVVLIPLIPRSLVNLHLLSILWILNTMEHTFLHSQESQHQYPCWAGTIMVHKTECLGLAKKHASK